MKSPKLGTDNVFIISESITATPLSSLCGLSISLHLWLNRLFSCPTHPHHHHHSLTIVTYISPTIPHPWSSGPAQTDVGGGWTEWTGFLSKSIFLLPRVLFNSATKVLSLRQKNVLIQGKIVSNKKIRGFLKKIKKYFGVFFMAEPASVRDFICRWSRICWHCNSRFWE